MQQRQPAVHACLRALSAKAWVCIAAVLLPLVAQAQVDPDARRRRIPGADTTSISVPLPDARTVFLRGKVVDGATGESLPGATVRLKNSPNGTITDNLGQFILRMPGYATEEVIVSYVGFITKTLPLRSGPDSIRIALEEGVLTADEVVVTASRFSQQLKETNVSISKLTLAELQASPSLNYFESLATVKELEGVSVGIGYKVYNARGFLALINNRFSQRADGVEIMIPGNNASVGNLLGPPDIDIENAEVLVGSASVLYGATAINGLLNLRTRSPFEYPGISYSGRVGVTRLTDPGGSPKPLYEAAVRYAKRVNREWAYKFVLAGFQAEDWVGDNTSDGSNYFGTTNEFTNSPGPGNPGYDGTNLFGDEIANAFSLLNFIEFPPGTSPITNPEAILRVARTGYRESDLLDGNTFRNFRASGALHFRPQPGKELVISSTVGLIDAMTPLIIRDKLNNYLFHQHRIEYLGEGFFIRGYASLQRNADMQNLTATGIALNRAVKSDSDWFTQYISMYAETNSELNFIRAGQLGQAPLPDSTDAAARAFADGNNNDLRAALLALGDTRAEFFDGQARLEPGTPAFRAALDSIRNLDANRGGGRIRDYTSLYHLEGQYDLSKYISWASVQVGGQFRGFRIRSEGSFYDDSEGLGKWAYEYGAYVNGQRRLFDDRMVVNLSARVDGNQDIRPYVSPRVAFTYNVDPIKKGFLRFSIQQSYRLPNLVQQFQDLNLGAYVQTNTRQAREKYNLQNNSYTLASSQLYTSLFQAGDRRPTVLRRFVFQDLRPEQITGMELGFRTTMQPGDSYVDVALFYNAYRDFIGLVPVIGPSEGRSQLPVEDVLRYDRIQQYQIWSNIGDAFSSYGYSISLQSQVHPKWTLSGNASYIRFQLANLARNEGLIDAYNTPTYKANVTLNGRHFYRNFNLGMTYRWVNGFEFVVPNFTGTIPSYAVVDAALSYDFERKGFQVKAGGSNILNNRHVEITFGPTIGAVYYLQVTFDNLLFKRF